MLESNGPGVEYVRVCMLLAETEATWSVDSAVTRIERLCYFAATLDASLRSEALAWIVARLKQDKYGRLAQARATLLETLCEDFKSTVEELLKGTAEHFEALRRTVRALVRADTDCSSQLLTE